VNLYRVIHKRKPASSMRPSYYRPHVMRLARPSVRSSVPYCLRTRNQKGVQKTELVVMSKIRVTGRQKTSWKWRVSRGFAASFEIAACYIISLFIIY